MGLGNNSSKQIPEGFQVFKLQGFDLPGADIQSFPDTNMKLVEKHVLENLKDPEHCMNYLPGYGSHYLKDFKKAPSFSFNPKMYMFFLA